MSDSDLIVEALGRMLVERRSAHVAHTGIQEEAFDESLWDALSEGGFPWVSVPESAGGVGGSVRDACAIIQTVAQHGVLAPVAETGLLGGWLLANAGMVVPDTPVTVAVGGRGDRIELRRDGDGWLAEVDLHRVPWARRCSDVMALAEHETQLMIVRLPTDSLVIEAGQNLAGEDRSRITAGSLALTDAQVTTAPEGCDLDALRTRGALARIFAMAGAMEAASDLTLRYSLEREQFGRPISRFQAVQHHLVRGASESAAASMAAELAVNGYEGGDADFTVAAAKVVVCGAADIVTKSTHQVHGAIGMTQEYDLHRFTRPLWAWRQEFGTESWWAERLGRSVVTAGADELWPRLTRGAVAS